MRKFLILLSLFALLMVPAFAQDEEPGTIADIVVASTEGDEPQFTVLLAALGAADPMFLEAVSSDVPGGFTVFAPTDEAFTALLEALEVTAEDLLASTDLLNEVLAYHVVPGTFDAEAVVGFSGSYIGTILNGYGLFVDAGDEGVFVNESQVIAPDVMASNGIVHVIDAVLVPEADEMMEEEMMEEDEMMEEMGTIVDIVVASTEGDEPEFTVLLAAVLAADPSVAGILSESGPWTVFAPTDEAFAAALEALDLTAEELLADTETLTEILSYHVLPGAFTAEDFGAYAEGMMEMEDDMMGLFFATALGGASIEFGDGMINESGLVATDIMADNGVIHVIDAVLLPPMGDDM